MTRILLADDHDLVRDTLADFMEARGMGPIERASDADGVMALLGQGEDFDLVMLDYNMPGMSGMAGLQRVLAAPAARAVVMISGEMSPALAQEALECGARGIMSKTISPDGLILAVQRIMKGEIYAPTVVQKRPGEDEQVLSNREQDVLRGICAGKSNKEIARDHDLQEVTVKLHVKTMSRKLGARNRTHAAMIARDRKMV